MNTLTFGHRLIHRLEKTLFTFVSAAGVTWFLVSYMVWAGKIQASFTEYTIFTLGILAIKSFKKKEPVIPVGG